MHHFFAPFNDGERIQLDAQESRHATVVLRLKEGSQIQVLDGKGNRYTAQLETCNSRTTIARVLSVHSETQRAPYRLHIGIAPTKSSDRFEWFLEKATEMGVDEITPLLCERSERRKINSERCRQILVSAMKQSGGHFLPLLNEPIPLAQFITANASKQCAIAHCTRGQTLHLIEFWRGENNYCLAIGPEGDFSPKEVTFAIQNQWTSITLGTSRLRTETAGVYAAALAGMLHS